MNLRSYGYSLLLFKKDLLVVYQSIIIKPIRIADFFWEVS